MRSKQEAQTNPLAVNILQSPTFTVKEENVSGSGPFPHRVRKGSCDSVGLSHSARGRGEPNFKTQIYPEPQIHQ